jgi:hypothetical protein
LIVNIGDGRGWIDPYAGTKTLAEITNDINPKAPSMYHLRAVDFAEQLEDDQYNGVLFTPPFNGLHIVSVYKTLNIPLRKNEASCFILLVGEENSNTQTEKRSYSDIV